MGCIKSKENKSPAIKYRPENTPEPVSTSVSHYGAEPTTVSPCPSSSAKGTAVNFSSLSMTPFGGSSGVTPFGGASSSFSVVPSSYPAGLTGTTELVDDPEMREGRRLVGSKINRYRKEWLYPEQLCSACRFHSGRRMVFWQNGEKRC